ncbi:MAG: anti-sigma factor [Acidimicrobiales bacterium]
MSTRLPAILDGKAEAPESLVSHVEYCLVCHAELARYRKLARMLRQLSANEIVVPTGIVADVLAAIEGAANRRAIRSLLSGRGAAYGSAVAGALAGGATIVLVALSRGRVSRTGRVRQEVSL